MATNAHMPSLPPVFAHLGHLADFCQFHTYTDVLSHGATSNLVTLQSRLDFFAHSLGRKCPNPECFPTPPPSFDAQPPEDAKLTDCQPMPNRFP